MYIFSIDRTPTTVRSPTGTQQRCAPPLAPPRTPPPTGTPPHSAAATHRLNRRHRLSPRSPTSAHAAFRACPSPLTPLSHALSAPATVRSRRLPHPLSAPALHTRRHNFPFLSSPHLSPHSGPQPLAPPLLRLRRRRSPRCCSTPLHSATVTLHLSRRHSPPHLSALATDNAPVALPPLTLPPSLLPSFLLSLPLPLPLPLSLTPAPAAFRHTVSNSDGREVGVFVQGLQIRVINSFVDHC